MCNWRFNLLFKHLLHWLSLCKFFETISAHKRSNKSSTDCRYANFWNNRSSQVIKRNKHFSSVSHFFLSSSLVSPLYCDYLKFVSVILCSICTTTFFFLHINIIISEKGMRFSFLFHFSIFVISIIMSVFISPYGNRCVWRFFRKPTERSRHLKECHLWHFTAITVHENVFFCHTCRRRTFSTHIIGYGWT